MTDFNDITAVAETADTTVAGLPTTLIVAGLTHQLSKGSFGYDNTDYLAPILDSVALIKERHSGDADRLDDIRAAVQKILGTVITTINREFDIDLYQLGVDPTAGDYESDVLDIYRFFVVDRLKNGRDLLARCVSDNRRQAAERYRKSVDRKNQTISEARRNFGTFEDVIIWSNMSKILENIKDETNWSSNFAESLQILSLESSPFLSRLANLWNPENFTNLYCSPALSGESRITTELDIQDWWLNVSPRKKTTETSEEPTNA